MSIKRFLASVFCVTAASCAIFDSDDVCAGSSAPNVAVTVVDSLTGTPAADGATLLTYDLDLGGVRVDSVTGSLSTDILHGTFDREGRYTVVVRKEGYRDWVKTNVIARGDCTLQTAILTAKLARP